MNTIHENLPLCAASDVDYTDIGAVLAYHTRWCSLYERAGGFSYPHVATPAIRRLEAEGIIWLERVGERLESCPLSEVARLLPAYDLLYRVCHGRRATGFLREAKLKAVDRWLKDGDGMSRTEIVRMLDEEIERDINGLEQRYVDYCLSVKNEWIEELMAFGRFVDTPSVEAYQRLESVITTDLTAYFGRAEKQEEAKRRWAEAYMLPDTAGLDSTILPYYLRFTRAASHLNVGNVI